MSVAEAQPAVPRLKLRWYQYSLRTLLVFTTVCAFGCGWLAAPTAQARRFVIAMRNGDYQRARSMFRNPEQALPGYCGTTESQARESKLEIAPLTLAQLCRGERAVHVYVPEGASMEEVDGFISYRVTAWGITGAFYIHQ